MAVNTAALFIIGAAVLFRTAEAFNFTECEDAIITFINQNPNATSDNNLFYNTDKSNPQPRYLLCEQLCGGGNNTITGDCGPRLSAWVLPILILVGSMKLPPLAWRQKLWAVLRLSGNPMGSQSGMIDELRLYDQCVHEGDRVARVLLSYLSPDQIPMMGKSMTTSTSAVKPNEKGSQNLIGSFARIIHAFSRSISGQTPLQTRESLEKAIHEMASANGKKKLEKFRGQVDGSGKALIEGRSRSTLRPLLAVACFIIPVVIALIPQVAGGVASGGMMASILTLSPFVLMVCLSNSIGEYRDLKHLSTELKKVTDSTTVDMGSQLCPSINKDITDLLEYSRINLSPSVEKDTGRLGHSLLDRSLRWTRRHIRRYALHGTLLLSFALGIALAGVAIGTPPTFFQFRHVLLIMLFVGWVFNWWTTSFLVNRYSVRNPPRGKPLAWIFIGLTHLLLAISGPIFLAGITCGLLGGCKMWSAWLSYGAQEARMQLNLEDNWKRNGKILYPILVSVCIGANLIAFFALRYWVFSTVFCVIAGQDDKIKIKNLESDLETVETSVEVAS